VTGTLRMSTYIGVSHQYKVEGPGGAKLTVWVQNLGASPVPHPGERVRLSWQPEHTFAVLPQEDLELEEGDAA
ncbi:MAG TPA: TOBE domain-containing protein, partial [Actinomycetota bacterium]